MTEDKAIQDTAEKYDLPEHVVRTIFRSQFKFLKDRIMYKEKKSVRLPKLGLFTPNKRNIDR